MKNYYFILVFSFCLFTVSINAQQNLVSGEYFWDTDPGEGSGTSLLALDGNFDQALEELFQSGISVSALSQGAHSFKVRVKGQDGQWSSIFSQTIFIDGALTTITRDAKIIMGEYFWDTDPSQGSGTSLLALDGNFDQALEELFKSGISVSSLSQGAHSFKVRVKGVDGQWSSVFSQTIFIDGLLTTITRDAKITMGEYFWDTDPGEGSGTSLLALDGNFDQALEELFKSGISVSSLSQGAHSFKVRVKGLDGQWSSVFSQTIFIDGLLTTITRDAKITMGEYFWDTDPGEGSGTSLLALDGNFDEALEELFKSGISMYGLSQGAHSFQVRVKGFDSQWSSTFRQTIVKIDTTCSQDTVQAAEAICSGSSYVFGTLTLSASGVYTQNLTSLSGCDSTVELTLTVNPVIQENISVSICSGSSYVFGSQTITSSGVYTEVYTSTSGCDSTVNLTLTVDPAIQESINMLICNGSSYVFGTQTLTSSGAYSEVYTSSSGCDSTVNLTLTVYPLIQESASLSICSGSSYVFGSQTLTSSGVYSEIFTSNSGCDSTVELTLVVEPVIQENSNVSICAGETYLFGSQVLSVSGSYTEVFTAFSGCDSNVYLNLVVNVLPIIDVNFTNDELTSTSGVSYQWYVDGQIITGATAVNYTPIESGVYSVLTLDFNGCYGEGEYVVIGASLNENLMESNLSIYPNPTKNRITIESSEALQVSLFNLSGGLLFRDLKFTDTAEINMEDYESGVYILELKNKFGTIQYKRVVKQ